ncbi:hypothetical protein Nepgr_021440 [Nepenthes gracilis]|uniref:Uncharacterized protein n=1 Tax=Nepenthes gracilis TaxID=150966 RepID=A0AAD3SYM4_NEPGR|nr:hypothetical protein Nepgr_021440 [Nepenthes gracilis]
MLLCGSLHLFGVLFLSAETCCWSLPDEVVGRIFPWLVDALDVSKYHGWSLGGAEGVEAFQVFLVMPVADPIQVFLDRVWLANVIMDVAVLIDTAREAALMSPNSNNWAELMFLLRGRSLAAMLFFALKWSVLCCLAIHPLRGGIFGHGALLAMAQCIFHVVSLRAS